MVDDPPAPLAPPDPPEVSGLIEGSDAWTTEPAVKGKRHEFGTGVVLPTGNMISHFESQCATNGTQQGDNVSNQTEQGNKGLPCPEPYAEDGF
jgi:hypothetical protein